MVKSAAQRAINCLQLKTIKEKIQHRVKNSHHNLLSHTSLLPERLHCNAVNKNTALYECAWPQLSKNVGRQGYPFNGQC